MEHIRITAMNCASSIMEYANLNNEEVKIMEFLVKLIEVTETSCYDARKNLYGNCCHVANNFWLFEGEEDSLHKGIRFSVVGEQEIEGHGDLTQSQIVEMVIAAYGVDRCFLSN